MLFGWRDLSNWFFKIFVNFAGWFCFLFSGGEAMSFDSLDVEINKMSYCWSAEILLGSVVVVAGHRLNPLRFCRSSKGCCRCHCVVGPMVILAIAVESQGIKMCAPSWDDRCGPCACTIQRHPRPISLRRIPAVWWTIASTLRAIKLSAMQHTKCSCLDSRRCPKRRMLLRWRAILM